MHVLISESPHTYEDFGHYSYSYSYYCSQLSPVFPSVVTVHYRQ